MVTELAFVVVKPSAVDADGLFVVRKVWP